MSETTLQKAAEKMAEAIREWNRAKCEREEWKPIIGQVPPVGILGDAKKANAMLAKALEEYEAFKQSTHSTRTAVVIYCKKCDGLLFAAIKDKHIVDDGADLGKHLADGHRIAEIPSENVKNEKWCDCDKHVHVQVELFGEDHA